MLYTFEQPVKCREMYLQTGNRQLPKTIITTGYAEVSYDGATYERAGDLEKGSITLKPGRAVKAVRIVSPCDDTGQQRRIGAAGRRHMDEKVASRMPSGHRRTDGTGGSNLHTDRPSDGRAGSDFTAKQKNRHCAR